MGFRHATLPIHGVQFHPESIATEHGHALLANFLRARRHAGRASAHDARSRSCPIPSRRSRTRPRAPAFADMLDGARRDEEIAAFLIALTDRGETSIEIAEAARALRERLIPIAAPAGRDRRLRHRRRRPPHAQRLDRGRAGRRRLRRARRQARQPRRLVQGGRRRHAGGARPRHGPRRRDGRGDAAPISASASCSPPTTTRRCAGSSRSASGSAGARSST